MKITLFECDIYWFIYTHIPKVSRLHFNLKIVLKNLQMRKNLRGMCLYILEVTNSKW